MKNNIKNKLKIFIKTNRVIKPIYKLTLKPRIKKQTYLFEKYGVELLEKFQNEMDSINVTFWLEFGTLLGAYREKDFIENDRDIDVGLFLSNDRKRIYKTLTSAGFKLIHEIEIEDGKYGLEQTYSYKGVNIDLFYFTQIENKIFCHVFKEDNNKTWEETILDKGGVIPQEHIFPFEDFKTISFKGMIFNVPSNIEEHLKANYGENFMIKDSTWSYTRANCIEILNDKIGIVKKY